MRHFYAVLLNDLERAIEIEIAAEEYFEPCSRRQVLSRLRNYYHSLYVPYDQPWELERRDTIAKIYRREEREATHGTASPVQNRWPSSNAVGEEPIKYLANAEPSESLLDDLKERAMFRPTRYSCERIRDFYHMAIEDYVSSLSMHASIRWSAPTLRITMGIGEDAELVEVFATPKLERICEPDISDDSDDSRSFQDSSDGTEDTAWSTLCSEDPRQEILMEKGPKVPTDGGCEMI